MIRDAPEVKIGLCLVYFWNKESSEAVCVACYVLPRLAGEERFMDLSQNQNFPGLHCCVNNIINL